MPARLPGSGSASRPPVRWGWVLVLVCLAAGLPVAAVQADLPPGAGAVAPGAGAEPGADPAIVGPQRQPDRIISLAVSADTDPREGTGLAVPSSVPGHSPRKPSPPTTAPSAPSQSPRDARPSTTAPSAPNQSPRDSTIPAGTPPPPPPASSPPDHPRLLWAAPYYRANVWAVLVWFWPELVLLVLLAVLGLSLRRAVRRWRRSGGVGEGEFCPRCHYSLHGAVSPTCPECGGDIRPPHRLRGVPRRGRWRVGLLPATALAGLLVLGWFWWPMPLRPLAWAEWGTRDRLPRAGRVSAWVHWDSPRLAGWGQRHGVAAVRVDPHPRMRVWSIDPTTGRVDAPMVDVPGVAELYRIGPHVLLCLWQEPGAEHLYRYDAPGQRWLELPAAANVIVGPGPGPLLWLSGDGTILYCQRLYGGADVLAWGTQTWQFHGCYSPPRRNDQYPTATSYRAGSPVGNSRLALMTEVWATGGFTKPLVPVSGSDRTVLWDPVTDRTWALPHRLYNDNWGLLFASGGLRSNFSHLLTSDQRFLIEDALNEPRAYDLTQPAAEPRTFVPPPHPAGTWCNVAAMALSRTGHAVYLHLYFTGGDSRGLTDARTYAWDLDTGRITPAPPPPGALLMGWRTPFEGMGIQPRIFVPTADPHARRGAWLPTDASGEELPLAAAVGVERVRLEHIMPVGSVSSPDGRLLASAIPDSSQQVLVWDRLRQRWLGRFVIPPAPAVSGPVPSSWTTPSRFPEVDLLNDRLVVYDHSTGRALVYELTKLLVEP